MIPSPSLRLDMIPTPTGIELQVCQDIAARQQKGIAKYGQTVAENPLILSQWLRHAYEECLDQAIYLKRAIQDLETPIPYDPMPSTATAALADPLEGPEDACLMSGPPHTTETLQQAEERHFRQLVENGVPMHLAEQYLKKE